jgi:hypothetical protein
MNEHCDDLGSDTTPVVAASDDAIPVAAVSGEALFEVAREVHCAFLVLCIDGRASMRTIARRVGLPIDVVRERIMRLAMRGVVALSPCPLIPELPPELPS